MWSRALAAAFLALPAAVMLVGLAALLGPGSLQSRALPWLLLFVPVWVVCMTAAFVLRTGLRAAVWLAAVVLAGFCAIWALKAAQWVVLP